MFNSTLLSINSLQIQLAMISPEVKSVIFTLSVLVLGAMLIFLAFRQFPDLVNKIRKGIAGFWASISSEKREARLHKVICHHCKVGMGVLNPIYRTREGISYIEGTCNVCGSFISARLR